MRNDARRLLARKRATIQHILKTTDRPSGYITLKLTRVLPALQRAEEKIAQGSYGICDDCDEKIPKARLKVAPGATRCTPCQYAFEKSLP